MRTLLCLTALLPLLPAPATAGQEDPEIAGGPLSAWTEDLTDPDWRVRRSTVEKLAGTGTEAFPALLILIEELGK
jgi:hypothetical protein